MSRPAELGVHSSTMQAQARTVSLLPAGRWHVSERIRDDPHVGDGLTYYELPTATVKRLHANSLIERAGQVAPSTDTGSSVTVWRCPERYRDRAQQIVDRRDSPVGCGHSGIRNIPGGGFSCTHDDCDVEVPRAEVER
jgi:hypothetical protein